jgi:hypothetical protein
VRIADLWRSPDRNGEHHLIPNLMSKLTGRTETCMTTEQWRDKVLAEATTADERTDLAAAFDRHESSLLAA